MSHILEINYKEKEKRKLLYIITFFITLLTGYYISSCAATLKYYFYYNDIFSTIQSVSLSAFMMGALFSVLLYSKVKNHKVVFILSEALYIVVIAVYFFRNILFAPPIDFIVSLYQVHVIWAVLFMSLVPFFAGMIYSYILKLASGEYIDEKNGLVNTLVSFIIGTSIGLALSYFTPPVPWVPLAVSLLSVVIVPLSFLVPMVYNPETLMTETSRTVLQKEESSTKRDSTLFIFLNVIYLTIFLYLASLVIARFYSISTGNLLIFLLYIGVSLLIGFLLGSKITYHRLFIFLPVAYPLAVVLFIVVLFLVHEAIPVVFAAGGIVPLGVLIGLTTKNSILHLEERFKHSERFTILIIAVPVIPAALITVLDQIPFTGTWFFIVLYIVSAVNLLLPTIYATSIKGKIFKKVILFAYGILIIPFFIFNHLYFNIPIDKNLFLPQTRNFSTVENTNYNSVFIKNNKDIFLNNRVIFHVDNTTIKGLKKGAVIPAFFMKKINDPVLALDSNQRFFINPTLSIYPDLICLDPLSDRNVDYRTIPVSGQQLYLSEKDNALNYLTGNEKRFSVIYSQPNVIEQTLYMYKGSRKFLTFINGYLQPDGIYVQLFTLRRTSPYFLRNTLSNTKSVYKHHRMFVFPGVLVVVSSNSEKSLIIDAKGEELIAGVMKRKYVAPMFFNEYQVLSHFIPDSIESIIELLPESSNGPVKNIKQNFTAWQYIEPLWNRSLQENRVFQKKLLSPEFYGKVWRTLARSEGVLNLLKIAEYAEDSSNFKLETENLALLQRTAQYNMELRDYITKIYQYKQKYYYRMAREYEKGRKWNNARELYEAMLTMDPVNFDALYQLGIIYITLQDLPKAFKVFQKALALKNNHPKVLFQLGVLFFSNQDYKKSFEYLNRALNQKEQSVALFLYLGLVYEKLNNIKDAERMLRKAMMLDPNDPAIVQQLHRIRKKIEYEKNKWKMPEKKNEMDAEEGVDVTLPVNKSAYDIRLKDE